MRAIVAGTLSAAAGLGLIVLLFRYSGTSLDVLANALLQTPWQLFALIIAIVICNNLAGALRWRATVCWLEPHVLPPSMMSCFQTTALGALSGFLLPPQFGTAAARWAIAAQTGNPASWALRSTIYEQLFDLLILFAAGIAGLTCLVLGASRGGTILAIGASLTLAIFLAQPVLQLSARLASRIATSIMSFGIVTDVGPATNFMDRVAHMPASRIASLLSYSIVRLLLQMTHGVAIAMVFAPMAKAHLVAAGMPASVLAFAIPISPGGLGVAEWTWSELLVLAGATHLSAANAALSNRVIYLAALLITVLLSVLMGAMFSARIQRQE